MFFSYVKIAFRAAVRQKLYTLINILGLAIGVTACIVILLYVQDELSYDRWNSKADRTYRIARDGMFGGNAFASATSPPILAATLVEEFPEVEAATRIEYIGGFPVIRYGDKAFSEERFTRADSNIFEVFDLVLILGDAKTALNEPNKIILSESTARRYFGDEDPMGKIMTSDIVNERMVTGVYKDIPRNSHFHYDGLISLITSPNSQSTEWLNNYIYTYFILKEGADWRELEAKLPGMVRRYVGPEFEQALGITWAEMAEQGSAYRMYLQPLTDIHLQSRLEWEVEINGNITYVYIFAVIAALILLIACINFMNLATARSANRAREVGIRKTVGSHRRQLVLQFLVESVTLTLIAIVLAVELVHMILPWFNNLVGLELSFNYGILPYVIVGAILVGILAGSYPAFFLSAFDPVAVLKGGISSNGKGSRLRNGLVIFQFTISIILFTGTMIVKTQLDYLQDKDMGYNPDNLLIVEKTDDIGANIEAFKQELDQHSSIMQVSNATTIPGQIPTLSTVFGMNPPDGGEPVQKLLDGYFVDFNFKSTFELEMAEGRWFSSEFSTDSSAVVLNEAAAVAFGLDEYIGQNLITFFGRSGTRLPIIGIVKDFHNESLHSKIKPMVLFPFGIGLFNGGGPTYGKFTALRIAPDVDPQMMSYIESTWMNHALDQAIEYVYFDDMFNALYSNEQRTATIADIFAVLTIFVACLGLLGLASFTAEQRTKEVGIRKILGATTTGIFTLLSRDVLKLVLISAVLSLPISYYIMNNWLENFAYRTSYSLMAFAVASILAIVIAILTVSWQAFKAATSNPVTALRYE
ncbi:MAG: ABC transporter permease [Candidatus Neomarinimicrobiota bacterium]